MTVLIDMHREHKARLAKIKKAAIIELAKEPIEKQIKHSSTPDIIIDACCEHYKVRHNDVLSNRRIGRVVQARHMACYIMYLVTKYTNSQIGKFLGLDISTVGYALKKIRLNIRVHREIIDLLETRTRKLIEEKHQREQNEITNRMDQTNVQRRTLPNGNG